MPSSLELVMDTWVLGCIADNDSLRALQGTSVLCDVHQSHRLALDAEGRIVKEYLQQISRSRLLKEWWRLMNAKSGKLSIKFARLTKIQLRHLVETIRFDPDDIPFVEVASVTRDNILVSGESDYSDEVKRYLDLEFGIRVLDLAQIREVLRSF